MPAKFELLSWRPHRLTMSKAIPRTGDVARRTLRVVQFSFGLHLRSVAAGEKRVMQVRGVLHGPY